MYDLFSELFNAFDIYPVEYTKEVRCPVCNRTYSDFKKTGRLGCGECYNTFRSPLSTTMRQIHPNPKHMGKIPAHQGAEILAKRHYEDLKKQLSDAVKREDYEAAAKLHKEIREIESNKN